MSARDFLTTVPLQASSCLVILFLPLCAATVAPSTVGMRGNWRVGRETGPTSTTLGGEGGVDLSPGQAEVGEVVAVARAPRRLLQRGHGGAGGRAERSLQPVVDGLDRAERVGHEGVVLDVDEVGRVVPGAVGGELPQTAGPQFQLRP